jgi:hypothetical protein
MRRGQKALGLLRRLPDLFGQGGEPRDAFQPFAFRGTEPALLLAPLEGGARNDDLLDPGFLSLGKVAHDVAEGGKWKTPADRPLQVGDSGHTLPEHLGTAQVLGHFQHIGIACQSTSWLPTWKEIYPNWAGRARPLSRISGRPGRALGAGPTLWRI